MRENTKHFVKDKKGARWSYSFIKSLAINASRIPHASIQFEWVTNIFLLPIRSQTQCWKLGWNKGSLQSFPRPLSSSAVVSRLLHKTKLPEGWGIQKKPPRKLLVHSIIARGFQLFNYTCTGIIFDWTAEDRKSRGAYRPDCAYLRHRKHICAQSKYFQKPKAFFSEDTRDSTEFI